MNEELYDCETCARLDFLCQRWKKGAMDWYDRFWVAEDERGELLARAEAAERVVEATRTAFRWPGILSYKAWKDSLVAYDKEQADA